MIPSYFPSNFLLPTSDFLLPTSYFLLPTSFFPSSLATSYIQLTNTHSLPTWVRSKKPLALTLTLAPTLTLTLTLILTLTLTLTLTGSLG